MLIKNIPNLLSISRIIITPFFVFFMFKKTFFFKVISLLMFFLGSLSDILDGYIARKYSFVTNFGKYIDPLADKILVLSAFVVLWYLYPDCIPLWMILVIFFRDIFVTFFRIILKQKNNIMKTSKLAKVKTLFQIILIHFLLILHSINIDLLLAPLISEYIYAIMFLCTIFTLFTGFHYFFINLNYFNEK